MKTGVIVVIVEGISDEDALYPHLRHISKKLNIRFEIINGDPFADKNNKTSVKSIVGNIINQEILSRSEYKKSDIKMIIQLTDTDGAYIPDNKIKINQEQTIKTKYTETNICVDTQIQYEEIAKRNKKKSNAMDTLSKTENVVGNLPYKILYFSRNLEHIIINEPDMLENEKSKKATIFSETLGGYAEFEQFFKKSNFAVKGSYDETWDFIRQDANSLQRFSNFHLIFDLISDLIQG